MNTSRSSRPRRPAKTSRSTSPSNKAATRKTPAILSTVEQALADMKAVDVKVLDVRGVSDVADYMVIASGTSDRHLRAVADRVVQMAKASGQRPLGIEGEAQGEWVLVDLPDVMVHLMLPRTREFYALEQLWDVPQREGVQARSAAARSTAKPRRESSSRSGSPARRTASSRSRAPRR